MAKIMKYNLIWHLQLYTRVMEVEQEICLNKKKLKFEPPHFCNLLGDAADYKAVPNDIQLEPPNSLDMMHARPYIGVAGIIFKGGQSLPGNINA